MSVKDTMKDLGLSYEEAVHGIQTGIKFRIEREGAGNLSFAGPKHLRTGLDMRAADTLGLVALLIDKGVFTRTEYAEYLRLAANTELHNNETHARQLYQISISFR